MHRPGALLIALATFLVIGLAGASPHLLGSRECTYGPSYWCENIPQATQCGAVSHCKQTVWEKHVYPVDDDEVCKICLDMVQQARDQLRSNETLMDLKAVFEGSCALIPIKLVRKECDNLVDNFIPQLVEALSSEMDPTAVCSVAKLCNNIKIDAMLTLYRLQGYGDSDEEYQQRFGNFNCKDCGKIGSIMEQRFKNAHPDDVLDSLLQGCRYLGSFSDACASMAIVHYQKIYAVLQQRLTRENICHLSGACYLDYHRHAEREKAVSDLEIRSMGGVGLIRQNQSPLSGDDLPCELCQKLVDSLRQMVIANSTAAEFKKVLTGVCEETGSFKDECISIVNQYSDYIFEAVSVSLNPKLICGIINICVQENKPSLLMPLLPLEPAKIAISLRKKDETPKFTKSEIDAFQLPFDALMGPQNADQLVENGEVCTLCEMILHFVQQNLAQPATEQQIKETVEKTCNLLPKSIAAECDSFVQTYGDAVMSMLIQEIDPSEVCPMLKMCSQRVKEDVEMIFVQGAKPQMHVEIESTEKPTCPLCLFAVTEAKERIQSDKSVQNIKRTLETLCTHLPQKLNVECTDFVDSYAQMLVNLLVKDLTAQQICVQLKLCTEAKGRDVPQFTQTPVIDNAVNSMENEIEDNTVNGRVVFMGHKKTASSTSTPECLVCQHLVKELEKRLPEKVTREQIKKVLDHVCDKVKPEMKDKCVKFIDKHEEQIIDLVLKGVAPKELCIALSFCTIASARQLTVEQMIDQMMNPMAEEMEFDENFSIDFISVPAGPMSVGKISLMNRQLEKQLQEQEDKDMRRQMLVESRQPPVTVRANEGCVMCEFVMTKLEADLKDKKTQDEIRKAVENVCSAMPKSVKTPCTKFVDQYSDLIVTLLTTIPPAQVCQQLGMCSPPKEDVDTAALEAITNDVFECAVCQGAVVAIDRLLEDPNFDRDLERVAEETCDVAPKKLKIRCHELVKAYGPSMINMLLAKAQPEQVCEEIKLCAPNEYSTFVQINDEAIPSRIRREVEINY